ncbi:hypothetical protein JST99_05110 [Candidatus Dependentiae bacterium]|nr:hypothetical protein [Candidatus Dependentiae bacterium]MCC7415295.1 hypothetical protein [Campylobacterota bacterium]
MAASLRLLQRLQLCCSQGLLRLHRTFAGFWHGLHGFSQRGFGHSRGEHFVGHDGCLSDLQQQADRPTASMIEVMVSKILFILDLLGMGIK